MAYNMRFDVMILLSVCLAALARMCLRVRELWNRCKAVYSVQLSLCSSASMKANMFGLIPLHPDQSLNTRYFMLPISALDQTRTRR